MNEYLTKLIVIFIFSFFAVVLFIDSKRRPFIPDENLRGTKGYLAFFVYSNLYITPIISVLRLLAEQKKTESMFPELESLNGWTQYKACNWVVVLAVIAWQILVATNLKRRHTAGSLQQARILCFFSPVLAPASMILLGFLTLEFWPAPTDLLAYIWPLLISWTWGLYFLFSRRCRTTYLTVPA